MKVPLVDLQRQHARVAAGVERAAAEVVRSQRFVLGPTVERFERDVAAFTGAEHAVGVSSGSDALVCALRAAGVGAGDEVVTTAFSFFATAEAIVRAGASPRFADVSPGTLNLDVEAAARAVGPRTRAIVAVDLYGQPAELDRLADLARSRDLVLIEDAAQAFGARFRGRRAGAWGTLGCFSFFPSKPLGGWGDGGMVVTSDAQLAELCGLVRSHGAIARHEHALVGGNFRLDALQAAVLGAKLGHVEEWMAERREHAAAYTSAFADLAWLETPRVAAGAEPAWALYTVRVKGGRRGALARHLAERGIQTAVHYPKPLYLQPALASLGARPGACPEAERAAGEVLSLPLFAELACDEREVVIEAVRGFGA
jgi:dTDP-4-amino-4,6-dideoxygalactose transaminase